MRKAFGFTMALAMAGMICGRALAEPPKAGEAAPAFTVKTLDGKEIKLEDLKGKVVYLDFWATWCPPCRAALPHTQEISARDEVKKGDLIVLAIDLKEDQAKIEKFLTDNKYSYPVGLDSDAAIAKAYGVEGIPTFVAIGRDGKVVDSLVGFEEGKTAKAIDKMLETALAAKAP